MPKRRGRKRNHFHSRPPKITVQEGVEVDTGPYVAVGSVVSSHYVELLWGRVGSRVVSRGGWEILVRGGKMWIAVLGMRTLGPTPGPP